MSVVLHSQNEYRGFRITIEQNDDGDVLPFAAHVPVPGHGYIDHYFATSQEALAAARTLVDARVEKVCPTCGQQLPEGRSHA